MPLDISDDKLQQLQDAPEEARVGFLNGLSQEEKDQLGSAVEGWKAKSAQPKQPEVTAPPVVAQVPEPTPAPEQSGGILDSVNKFKDEHIAPAIQGFQQKVGKPIVDFLTSDYAGIQDATDRRAQDAIQRYQAAGDQGAADSISAQMENRKAGRSARDMLYREGLSWLNGDEQLDQIPEKEKLAAINHLESRLGTTGAATAQSLAHEAGRAPLLFMSVPGAAAAGEAVGAAAKAAKLPSLLQKAASVLGTGAAAGAENVVLGLPSRMATTGQSLIDKGTAAEFGVGAGLGAGIHGAANVFNAFKSLRTARKGQASTVALATQDAANDLAHEISQHPDMSVAKVNDPTFKPTIAEFGELSNGSNGWTLRELNADGTGRIAELNDSPQAHALIKQKGVDVVANKEDYILRKVDEVEALPKEAKVSSKVDGAAGETSVSRSRVNQRPADFTVLEQEGALRFKHSEPRDPTKPLVVGDEVVAMNGPHPKPAQILSEEGDLVKVRFHDGQVDSVPRSGLADAPPHEGGNRILPDSAKDIFLDPQVADHVWENGHITPASLARAADVSEVEAQRALAAMDSGSLVRPKEGGAYTVDMRGDTSNLMGVSRTPYKDRVSGDGATVIKGSPPSAPEKTVGSGRRVDDRFSTGDLVFTGRTTGEDAEYGRITGKNADGTYKVQTKVKTATEPAEYVSVAPEAVHPTSLAKNRLGFSVKPKLDVPATPAAIPPAILDQYNNVKGMVDRLRSTQPGMVDRVMDKLRQTVPDFMMGSLEQRQLIHKLQGSQVLGETADNLTRAYQKTLGGPAELWGELATDANKYLNSRLAFDDMLKKHGDRWQAFYDQHVEPTLKEANAREKRILELGGVSEDSIANQIARGENKAYATYLYRAQMMPKGEYAKIAPQATIDDAIVKLGEQIRRDSRQHIDEGLLADDIMRVMKAENPIEAAKNAPGDIGKAWRKLLARTTLPPWVQSLLGKENSAAIRMAHSLAAQRQLHTNLETWNEITTKRAAGPDGQQYNPWWSPGRRSDLPYHIPDEPAKYGPAAGGYTDEVFGRIVQAQKATQDPNKVVRDIGNVIKFNWTVGGGTAAAFKDFIGNAYHSMLAGGMDIFHPIQSGKDFRDGIAAMRAFSKAPYKTAMYGPLTKEHSAANLALEAKEFAADVGGHHVNQMNISKNAKMQRALQDHMGSLPANASYMETLKGLYRATKAAGMTVVEARDFIDASQRLGNYVALKRKYLTKYAKAGAKDANEAAARMAAYRLNESYPNPRFNSPLIKGMQASTPGVMMPMPTWPLEAARVALSLPGRLSEGLAARNPVTGKLDPALTDEAKELWGRLIAWGSLGAALKYGGQEMRRMNGISDEQSEAAKMSLSESSRYYKPLTYTLPWHDSQGRPQVVDLTQHFPQGQLMQGNAHDPALVRMATNALITPVQGSFAEQSVREKLAQFGGAKAPEQYTNRPGSTEMADLLNKLYGQGAVPQQLLSVAKDLQQVGPKQEESTVAQKVAKQAGFNVTPVGPKRVLSTVSSMSFKMQELMGKQLKQVASDPNMSPERKKMLIQQLVDEAQKYAEDLQVIGKGTASKE